MVKEYEATNCISFSGKIEYSRGKAYAMALGVCNVRSYSSNLKTRFCRLLTFLRYCIHGGLPLRDSMRLWGANSPHLALLMSLPLAHLLALKDRLPGEGQADPP